MRDCEKCGTKNEDNASFCINCSHPLKAKDTVGGVQTAPLPSTKPSGKSETDPNLELEPGHLFAGRYEIVDKIGQGGMGTVYHAKDTIGANRDIALKLIKGSLLVDQVARDRLIHEGVLTQDIRHPNVVAVHNVGVHNEQPFVAMAYVEGVSMREWLIRNFNYRNEDGLREDIPFPVVAKIIHAILDGLEAAHKLGIVHRDLKPENIILTAEPDEEEAAALQILDFGIARAPGPPLSTASGGMGTQGYIAPEQLTNPAGVDGSADLYSLSRMFYEMLMRAVPSGEIQDPSGGRTDVPKAIDALIRKGLSDDAGRRPQTVAEYRAALKKAVGEGQTGGRKGPSRKDIEKGKNIPPPPPPPEVPRTLVIGGGIGLAFVAVVGILNIPTDDFEGGDTSSSSSSSSTSSTLSSGGSTTSSSSFGGDDPLPPPPPEEPDYSVLSGSWFYSSGIQAPVTVQPDGMFRGAVNSPDGLRYDFSGDLSEGTLYSRSRIGEYSGTIIVSDNSHLCYDLYDVNGNLFGYDRLHVNHPPGNDGGACP